MAKKKSKTSTGPSFSANGAAQSVFRALNDAIRGLPNDLAIMVCDEVISHTEAMTEAMKEEDAHAE